MARILVVDDEQDVLDLISDLLAAADHQVATARDGDEALARIGKGPLPDLVITDLLMPKMNGLTLIREIRRRLPKVGIIAISGGDKKGGLKFLSVARTLGSVRTLDKPFHQQELLALVRGTLAERAADPGA